MKKKNNLKIKLIFIIVKRCTDNCILNERKVSLGLSFHFLTKMHKMSADFMILTITQSLDFFLKVL